MRFIGILNAAVWLGGMIFFTVAVAPAVFSRDMSQLLGAQQFPYFSGAVAQILLVRFFGFQTVCAIIALLHLLAQRLYLGRSPGKLVVGLAIGLLAMSLIGGNWLQPRLSKLQATRYAPNALPAERDSAARSFRRWHVAAEVLNLAAVAGLTVYLWRMANPPDSTRFLNSVKFRG